MALGDRLQTFVPSNDGCRTCSWYAGLDTKDRLDFDTWLSHGGSITGLHRACVEQDRDPSKPPLRVGVSAFLLHVRNHHKALISVAG